MSVWLMKPCYVMLEDQAAKTGLCMPLPVPLRLKPSGEVLVVILPAFGNRVYFTSHPNHEDCQADLWSKHVLKPVGISYKAILEACLKKSSAYDAINCT